MKTYLYLLSGLALAAAILAILWLVPARSAAIKVNQDWGTASGLP